MTAATLSLEPDIDFGSMTKAQLLAYASDNDIAGVNSGMTKAEIIEVLNSI